MHQKSRLFLYLTLIVIIFTSSPLFGTPRDEWLSNEESGTRFHFHERDRQLIDTLLPLIIADFNEFHRKIAFYPEVKGDIVIAPDREYYQSVIAGHSGIIEFSEALYKPSERTIYIRNPRDLRDFTRLRKIVLHEYIHLFLDTQLVNIPLWFHEGMAVFFSGDLSFDRELRYARDFLLGNSLSLNDMIYSYPESRIRWESFYAKSALAVKYLYTSHNEEFYSLWEYTESREDFSLAFFRAFNLTPRQFSPLLEDHLKKRFRIEILLAFTGVVWGLLPFILLFAWLRKKWLNRNIRKSWDTPPQTAVENNDPERKDTPQEDDREQN